MKFNHPHTVLWDEMDTLRREDFPLQFPSELISQVPVKTQVDNHVVTTLCRDCYVHLFIRGSGPVDAFAILFFGLMIPHAHFYFLSVPMFQGLQVRVARHLVFQGAKTLGLDFPLTGFLTTSSFRR